MGRTSLPSETLYYGSDRQQQYWENESQTLRIVRESTSSIWLAYRKEDGTYHPVPARQPTRAVARKRRRKKIIDSQPLAGRSAEEVVEQLRKAHHLHLFLEQRLRRWMNKNSGERVLAFLDPNQGGAPVMKDPGLHVSRSALEE
ncbi:MAG: hypothetical protein FJ147_03330 [Deltaproteobacteria bacterium]|nr:hypothetical protein [Deltaproteobacteria bacterium]